MREKGHLSSIHGRRTDVLTARLAEDYLALFHSRPSSLELHFRQPQKSNSGGRGMTLATAATKILPHERPLGRSLNPDVIRAILDTLGARPPADEPTENHGRYEREG